MGKVDVLFLSWVMLVIAMVGGLVASQIAESDADKWLACAVGAIAAGVLTKGCADAIDD